MASKLPKLGSMIPLAPKNDAMARPGIWRNGIDYGDEIFGTWNILRYTFFTVKL